MTEETELKERLKLIESMISEGRRSTESWGWTFILWGVAYYIATAWATWGKSNLAWPVTMVAAALVTGIVCAFIARDRPATALGRAIGGVWMAIGCGIFVLLFSLAFSGRYDAHVFVAIIGAMLGSANAVSAFILRWKMQFLCALIWMASTVIACFGSDSQTSVAFLASVFLGQIVFGIYAMVCESQRRHRGAVHA